MSEAPFVVLQQEQDYVFSLHFGADKPLWNADEDPPLGTGRGPTPVQLLLAAVGNCLSDALLFALRKFKQTPEPIQTRTWADMGRNSQGRMRVLALHVTLKLGVPAAQLQHLDRVLDQFEDFCTVGASVAQGIPLHITVLDALEQRLKPSPAAPLVAPH